MAPSTLLLPLALLASTVSAADFQLLRKYSGDTFFDNWTFFTGVDSNSTGNVLWQSKADATAQKLIGTLPNGNVFMKADNTTNGVNNTQFGRPSVKIASDDTLVKGDMLVLDAVHMPFGCSVWTGFWSQGSNWPIDGEIDIIENVNQAQNNRMSLHTGNNCMHTDSTAFAETGSIGANKDCFNQTQGNEGCVVTDPRTTSYGAAFNSGGGGVYAVLRDDDGIKMWFFPRANVPADLSGNNPNPAGWGSTTAFFPASSCQTDFGKQSIYFHINICGNFAGADAVFGKTCSGGLVDCLKMVGDPANYNNAYYEIKSLSVFTTNAIPAGNNPNGGNSGSQNGGSGGGGNGNQTKAPGSAPTLAGDARLALAIGAIGIYFAIALFGF